MLFTTAAPVSYLDYRYRADDILLFGRESAGVPEEVHAAADARLVIPMRPGLRSLNVAVAAAMAAGEALRQTGRDGGLSGYYRGAATVSAQVSDTALSLLSLRIFSHGNRDETADKKEEVKAHPSL